MKEHEIRPEALLNRYLELSARDAAACFGDAPRQAQACVGCGGERSTHEFDKHGFSYAQCTECGTLFQSPRPPIAAFEAFYRKSASSKCWAEAFQHFLTGQRKSFHVWVIGRRPIESEIFS